MSSLPLVSHLSPDSTFAWRADGAVTLRQFLEDVGHLASQFPAGMHLLNLYTDRYRFSVGLAAAIVAGKVSLLPSTRAPETLRQIKVFAPDAFCLTDDDPGEVDMPQLRYPEMKVSPADTQADTQAGIRAGTQTGTLAIPQIDRRQRVAIVFTSGSTGIPQPFPKTWGALVSSVRAEMEQLGLPQDSHFTLVGTVPPQHMYGFESTVLMAWQSGNAFSHAQPLYPADICRVLASVPAPRMLVSSPVHLQALLASGLELPEIEVVVSATAPLSAELAKDVEARCRAPLHEIYGSTETGQIAARRPTHTAEWRLFPGIELVVEGENVRACGDPIDTPTVMNDVIELIDKQRFLLQGRKADLVNIAGKRHSLASLNHLLNSIAGVEDGAFFMPDETHADHVTRLAACVVAPGIDASGLLAALRLHIDPVFLPRPLLFVDELPRNSTGKLPRDALQALLQARAVKKSV
jgi:acyl-coenzyme A synthetase/AMP-(fatty) acid ligase